MTGYLWLAALIGGVLALAPIVVGELGLLIHKGRCGMNPTSGRKV